MRLLLSAVSLAALVSGAAVAAETATFDLYKSSEVGKTVIAVAATGDKGPFAAASGAEAGALDVLAAEDASLAVADLRARTLPAMETAALEEKKAEDHKGDHAGKDTAGAHKIVIVKEVKAQNDGEEEKEARRIIKLKADGEIKDAEIKKIIEEAKAELGADKDAKVAVEQSVLGPDDADAALLASVKAGKVFVVENEVDGKKTRLVSIAGADLAAAKAFIDEAGLDESEKAAMKTTLGL